MKKIKLTKKFIIFVITIIVLILLVIGFKYIHKQTYTVETFTNTLKEDKYIVKDKTLIYKNNKEIKNYIQSKDKTKSYQVDYYSMNSENSAQKYYEKLVNQIEKDTYGLKGKTQTNKMGYSKYLINTDGSYIVIIKSNDTVIYINAKDTYKDSIDQLLKKLGY